MDRTKMFGHKRGGYSLCLSTFCAYCTAFKMSREVIYCHTAREVVGFVMVVCTVVCLCLLIIVVEM